MRVEFYFIVLCFLSIGVCSFGLTVGAKSKRCFTQHMEEYVLTKGKYILADPSVFTEEKTNMKIKVLDPNNKAIYSSRDFKKGKFYFNTPMSGTYTTCFKNKNSFSVDVFFKFKFGIEAKDYSNLAQMQNIMEVDTQTQWIVDSLYEVKDTVNVIQEHEEEIRDIASESYPFMLPVVSLDHKMIFFSGITVVILLVLSIAQMCLLKRRLVKAKLL